MLICQARYPTRMATAGPKLKITQEIILKMLGLTEEINVDDKKPVDPYAWVMTQCGVSFKTVHCWSRGTTSSGLRPAGATLGVIEDFCAAFDGLREVCARGPIKAINKIVDDNDHPKQLNAATWMAGKTWPERWGEKATTQVGVTIEQASNAEDVADIEQEVFDEMTDDEYNDYEALAQQIASLQAQSDEIIKAVKKRVK